MVLQTGMEIMETDRKQKTMLTIRNLYAYYGPVTALNGVTCHVREGEIVTLIGANGVGKTTLLNAICGLVRRRGEVRFAGENISGLAPEAIVSRGISQVPEGRQLFAPMTVAENLELGAYRRSRRRERGEIAADLERVYSLFPRLKERIRQTAGTLSGGEQQMLAIGRALMARPRLLCLDEPSLGLAPIVVEDILATLGRLREGGVTILLVEQNARAALKVADRAYVLETGRIILSGASSDLLQDRQVTRAYLGRDYKEFTEGR
jgi:branched-chain amino acid transport system ATP-binding protein